MTTTIARNVVFIRLGLPFTPLLHAPKNGTYGTQNLSNNQNQLPCCHFLGNPRLQT